MTGLTALAKIELPTGTAFICDAGVTEFDGDIYTQEDAVLGSLAAIESMTDGGGDQIPALDLDFAAPGAGAISALSNGSIQQSRVELRVAEYDSETGVVIGTPDFRFAGIIDQPQISAAQRELSISVSVVSELEFMFARRDGNGLSSSFHKALYPGERGHDNATGLNVPGAWGVESPNTNTGGAGGGGGGFVDPNGPTPSRF